MLGTRGWKNKIERLLAKFEKEDDSRTSGLRLRSKTVAYSLLLIMILFCIAVGFGLASNNVNAWGLVIVTVFAVIALQLSYVATVIIEHWK